jgi:hypothetical protein
MKTIIISGVFILMSITSFAQNICPGSLKRNNGNGTCNSLGELQVYFPSINPESAPIIDSVLIDGVKTNVTFDIPETSHAGGLNCYISYCVTSGNMPPANVWTIYFHVNGGDSYSCTVFSPTDGPLSVKYYSFDASVSDNGVTCSWITEEEINNNYFELERSFDGVNYNTTAMIFTAENNTGALQSYQYKDKATALKNKYVVYYRIKQVDKDGSASYSKVVTVKLKADPVNFLQIAPNPFIKSLTIKLEAGENGYATTKIMNANGQTVSSTKASVNKDSNNLQIANLSGLSKGIYVVQVSVNGVIKGNQK